MKFDSLFEKLFTPYKQISEMALGIYFKKPYIDPDTGEEKPMRNKVGGTYKLDTPEEVTSKSNQWKSDFKTFLLSRRERGSGMYSIGKLYDAISDVVPIDEDEFYTKIADTVADTFFPDGLNTARNWEEFRLEGVPVLRNVLQDIAKEYGAHFHTNDTNINYAVNNIVKGFSKKSAAEVYIHGDEDYKEGSTSARGRKSKEQQAKEDAEGRFEESYLVEMPVQIKGPRGTDFKKKWKDALSTSFADKHSHVSSEHSRGSDTYHVLDIAKKQSGSSTHEEVPVMSIKQASDMLADIIYDKIYNEKGYSSAKSLTDYRKQLTDALNDAINILEQDHGIEFRVGNKAEFTARIIDNAAKRAGIDIRTGADGSLKTWKSSDISESTEVQDDEDDDDDDEEDEDGDNEITRNAYEQGFLRDDEESEESEEEEEEEGESKEEPSESEEEESADTIAQRQEQAGVDIADIFMREFERLYAEDDEIVDDDDKEEDSIENGDDLLGDFKPESPRFEDEEERFSSWDRDWMSRDYDTE